MSACPACGGSLPEGARFCPACGARLTVQEPPQERKVVTTLFCDLVGFTAFSERADPEDVDGVLRPYYALARHVIGQYGGSVEKFIGDAVVGVFGVPRLHEDDAERAVRAAVRLQERITELRALADARIQARIGVNTGHALVRAGVDPASGEGFLVGDPVNTAARLQAMAPPGGVVVGELTHSMAPRAATFAALGPVRLKGKREHQRVWRVTGRAGRPGVDLARSFTSPLVGREVELGILSGLFDKAVASSATQIALVVADAGLGKTRLLHEFARSLDERSDVIVWWRQGQCPAYGEDRSLWPLAQVLRQHAAVTDDDDAAEAEAKLRRMLSDLPDREWLESRLRPLLGLASPPAAKEENFAAWLRFIEVMARAKPTVLVFEDVHWASPLMVDFLWHLAARLQDLPLLGIGTARPEFLAGHPDYETVHAADANVGRVVQIDLHPLSPPETDRLVASLTRDRDVGAARQAIARRSGGNPLYAEELARLLDEQQPSTADLRRLDQPARDEVAPSLQALVAARLDALSPELKELLSDAAVVGEVFEPTAVAAVRDLELGDVSAALIDLEGRGFVRPQSSQSRHGEREYAFWHAVTRDVAYARMTRKDRANRHLAVARLLDRQDDAVGDRVQLLAYHYRSAFNLLQATHERESAEALREPVVRAVATAADQAMGLDCALARVQYEQAVHLVPEHSQPRGMLLAKLGRALTLTGEPLQAVSVLESAVDAFSRRHDRLGLAAAKVDLSRALLDVGDIRAHQVAREAVDALENSAPSPELIAVLEGWAAAAIQLDRMDDSLDASGRALEAAAALDQDPPLTALECRAWARCATGQIDDGLDDARRLLALLREATGGPPLSSPYGSVAELLALYSSLPDARAVIEEGLQRARDRHDDRETWALRVCELELLGVLGEWDDALAGLAQLDDHLVATEARLQLVDVRCIRAIVQSLRSDAPSLEAFLQWLEREKNVYFGLPFLDCLAAALAHAALGQAEPAAERLHILATKATISTGVSCLWWPEAVRCGIAIGRSELAGSVATRALGLRALPPHARTTIGALHSETAGDAAHAAQLHLEASTGWASAGCRYELGESVLGRARCLTALGAYEEAKQSLAAALPMFTELKAVRALRESRRLAERLGAAGCAPQWSARGPRPARGSPPRAGDT